MTWLLLFDRYLVFAAKSKNGSLGLTESFMQIYLIFNILSHYCY